MYFFYFSRIRIQLNNWILLILNNYRKQLLQTIELFDILHGGIARLSNKILCAQFRALIL